MNYYITYKNGIYDGAFSYYWFDNKKQDGFFKNGLKDGFFIEYYTENEYKWRVGKISIYENDTLLKWVTYSRKGDMIKQGKGEPSPLIY